MQQIINKNDWTPGNDIVFIVEGTGVSLTNEDAIRVADSYEGKPEHPATLIYTYYFDAALVGIKIEKSNTDSNVYPNPFNNTLHFNIPSIGNQTVIVQITDVLGKILFSKMISINNNYFTINPDIQKKGIYIVRVISLSNEEILNQKIIKY